MLYLALLKLGFDPVTIAAMPEGEALAWLAAQREPMHPKKEKRYKVMRKNDRG
jgi:hypothetical protein